MQFQNRAARAAKQSKRLLQSSVFEMNESNNYADMVNDNDTAQFALIDKDKLKLKTIVDTGTVVSELKAN